MERRMAAYLIDMAEVFGADNPAPGTRLCYVPAGIVDRDGWRALGGDYYIEENHHLIAGPNGGETWRSCVKLLTLAEQEGE